MDDKTMQVVRLILTAKEMTRAIREKDYAFAEYLLSILSNEIEHTEAAFDIAGITPCA